MRVGEIWDAQAVGPFSGTDMLRRRFWSEKNIQRFIRHELTVNNKLPRWLARIVFDSKT